MKLDFSGKQRFDYAQRDIHSISECQSERIRGLFTPVKNIFQRSQHVTTALAVMILFALSGCRDKSDLLVKTWVLEDLQYTRKIPADMMPEIQAAINQMKGVFRITYFPDGTYKTSMNQQLVAGTWRLNWNSTKLMATTRGESSTYSILKLTDSRFEFIAPHGKEEVVFIMSTVK